MMMISVPAWLAGLALLVTTPALAQVAPGLPEDPGAAVVEELVVQAKEPGPAWWVVRDGDSTVYILGMPGGGIPPKSAWDRRYLDRRLKGANSLILADSIRISVGISSFGEALRLYRSLRSDVPLETRLQEPLRSQFIAARRTVGQSERRYARWSPFVASLMLVGDSAPKGWVDPREDIIRAARKARVKRVQASAYDASSSAGKILGSMDPAVETACLSAAVRTVQRARPAETAEGWARGDVAGAISGPRDFEGCLLLLNGGPQIWRAIVSEHTRLIAEGLKTPGHSVALVDLSMLVAEEGVLRRLEDRGLTVTGPGGS
ncbi:MAG: TraB/GumN family protein [Phenylobacterium sp.]|nr:TraB/GumN family protein [Phenylobacterium sp.]